MKNSSWLIGVVLFLFVQAVYARNYITALMGAFIAFIWWWDKRRRSKANVAKNAAAGTVTGVVSSSNQIGQQAEVPNPTVAKGQSTVLSNSQMQQQAAPSDLTIFDRVVKAVKFAIIFGVITFILTFTYDVFAVNKPGYIKRARVYDAIGITVSIVTGLVVFIRSGNNKK